MARTTQTQAKQYDFFSFLLFIMTSLSRALVLLSIFILFLFSCTLSFPLPFSSVKRSTRSIVEFRMTRDDFLVDDSKFSSENNLMKPDFFMSKEQQFQYYMKQLEARNLKEQKIMDMKIVWEQMKEQQKMQLEIAREQIKVAKYKIKIDLIISFVHLFGILVFSACFRSAFRSWGPACSSIAESFRELRSLLT